MKFPIQMKYVFVCKMLYAKKNNKKTQEVLQG